MEKFDGNTEVGHFASELILYGSFVYDFRACAT